MKKGILLIFILAYNFVLSQVGINTDTPRGILHLESTTGGFVPPSLTTAQRDALTVEMRPKSTIIFNTDENVLQMNTGTDETPIWSTFYFPSDITGTETKKFLYNASAPDTAKEVIIGKFKFRIISSTTTSGSATPQFALVSDPGASVTVTYQVGQYYDNGDVTSGGYQYMNTSTTFTSTNYSTYVNLVATAAGPDMSYKERNEMWLAYPGDDSIYHVQFLIVGSSASSSSNTYGILVNKY